VLPAVVASKRCGILIVELETTDCYSFALTHYLATLGSADGIVIVYIGALFCLFFSSCLVPCCKIYRFFFYVFVLIGVQRHPQVLLVLPIEP
jgi:hypothetical protein